MGSTAAEWCDDDAPATDAADEELFVPLLEEAIPSTRGDCATLLTGWATGAADAIACASRAGKGDLLLARAAAARACAGVGERARRVKAGRSSSAGSSRAGCALA